MYQWLRDELQQIHWRGFHVIRGSVSAHLQRSRTWERLPRSYRDFLNEFGTVKLYQKLSYYQISVRDVVEEKASDGTELLYCFGHFDDRKACFRSSLLTIDCAES